MNLAAERTRQHVRSLRMLGLARRPRKVLPRQVPPIPIEREYARAILHLLEQMRPALAEVLDALPELLESAARERSVHDSLHDPCNDALSHYRDLDNVIVAPIRADAGEGKRLKELMARAAARMGQAISPGLVEQLGEKFARRTATYQRVQLNRQVKAALGADVFIADRGLEAMVEGFAAENAALITSIPRELMDKIAKASTRAIQSATPHPQLAKEIAKDFGMATNRAKLIARDQVGKLYGQVNAQRQKAMGVERFIWNTVHDERVRPEHAALDGKEFSYDKPPAEGLPGEPILCRCYASPVFDLGHAAETPSTTASTAPVETETRKPRTVRQAPKPPAKLPSTAVEDRLNKFGAAMDNVAAGRIEGSAARVHVRLLVQETAGMTASDGEALGYRVEHDKAKMAAATGVTGTLAYNAGSEVVASWEVHYGAQQFAQNVARGNLNLIDAKQAVNFQAMLHEEVHSMGVRRIGAYQGAGAVVEEVATEVSARAIMRDNFGDFVIDGAKLSERFSQAAPLSYSVDVTNVRNTIISELGVTYDQATEILEQASRGLKRRTGDVNTPQGMVDLFVGEISGLDFATRSRLSSSLMRLRIGG